MQAFLAGVDVPWSGVESGAGEKLQSSGSSGANIPCRQDNVALCHKEINFTELSSLVSLRNGTTEFWGQGILAPEESELCCFIAWE